jgi:hypothetical protein
MAGPKACTTLQGVARTLQRARWAPRYTMMSSAVILSWLITLALPGPAPAQTQPAWFGTWKLNLAKSTYSPGPPPFTRATRRIEASGDDVTIVDEMVRSRGGVIHLEWTGKFDGRDYPVQGVELVLTNAYRRVDDHRYELIQKMDGEVVATARLVLSPDGKTVTTVNSSRSASATTIYEKQ